MAGVKVGWVLLPFLLSPGARPRPAAADCRGLSGQGGFLPQLLQTWQKKSLCSYESWRCRKGCTLAGGCSRYHTRWAPQDHSSKISPWLWAPGGDERLEAAHSDTTCEPARAQGIPTNWGSSQDTCFSIFHLGV